LSLRRSRLLAYAPRRPFAREPVESPLDRGEPLLETLDAAHALLELVDPLAQGPECAEHPVRAGSATDPLDRLLADVGEPFHDVLLSGPGHGPIVPVAMDARRAYAPRVKALAASAARPDFVGFQELSLYRTQTPADFTVTPATTVALDYARELRKALAARKLRYRFLGIRPETDAELPSGNPPTMDVRLTVRDALL